MMMTGLSTKSYLWEVCADLGPALECDDAVRSHAFPLHLQKLTTLGVLLRVVLLHITYNASLFLLRVVLLHITYNASLFFLRVVLLHMTYNASHTHSDCQPNYPCLCKYDHNHLLILLIGTLWLH